MFAFRFMAIGQLLAEISEIPYLTFYSRSRSWPRSNPMVTFEALDFNRYVCFWFRGNRTIFG